MKPKLYIFAGLPGAGKTTLAQRAARELGAAYLRLDTIEQGLRDLCGCRVQGEGYRLAYRIAKDNLLAGMSVIADSCNPIILTRDEWEEVAREAGCHFINIEVLCSDKAEHKYRLQTRVSSVAGLTLPSWKEVEAREYHPWDRSRIVIDTAGKSEDGALAEMLGKLKEIG